MPHAAQPSNSLSSKRKRSVTSTMGLTESNTSTLNQGTRPLLQILKLDRKRRKLQPGYPGASRTQTTAKPILKPVIGHPANSKPVVPTICTVCNVVFGSFARLVQHCADPNVHNPRTEKNGKHALTPTLDNCMLDSTAKKYKLPVARQAEQVSTASSSSDTSTSSEKSSHSDCTAEGISVDLETSDAESSSEEDSDDEEVQKSDSIPITESDVNSILIFEPCGHERGVDYGQSSSSSDSSTEQESENDESTHHQFSENMSAPDDGDQASGPSLQNSSQEFETNGLTRSQRAQVLESQSCAIQSMIQSNPW